MKTEPYIPTILDFAHDVIALHKENNRLYHELEHYKELNRLNNESINQSIEHSKEMTGIIFKAILDPKSSINQRRKESHV